MNSDKEYGATPDSSVPVSEAAEARVADTKPPIATGVPYGVPVLLYSDGPFAGVCATPLTDHFPDAIVAKHFNFDSGDEVGEGDSAAEAIENMVIAMRADCPEDTTHDAGEAEPTDKPCLLCDNPDCPHPFVASSTPDSGLRLAAAEVILRVPRRVAEQAARWSAPQSSPAADIAARCAAALANPDKPNAGDVAVMEAAEELAFAGVKATAKARAVYHGSADWRDFQRADDAFEKAYLKFAAALETPHQGVTVEAEAETVDLSNVMPHALPSYSRINVEGDTFFIPTVIPEGPCTVTICPKGEKA